MESRAALPAGPNPTNAFTGVGGGSRLLCYACAGVRARGSGVAPRQAPGGTISTPGSSDQGRFGGAAVRELGGRWMSTRVQGRDGAGRLRSPLLVTPSFRPARGTNERGGPETSSVEPHCRRATGADGTPIAAQCACSRCDTRVSRSGDRGAPDLLGAPAASSCRRPDRAQRALRPPSSAIPPRRRVAVGSPSSRNHSGLVIGCGPAGQNSASSRVNSTT